MEAQHAGFPVKWVSEGEARLLVPDVHEVKRSSIPFYNPVASLNRDISLAVVSLLHEPRVADVMTGVGARAIRYALIGAKVDANDLSPSSLSLLLKSARENGVSENVMVQSSDARVFLAVNSSPNHRYDLVDLDPFGSPAPYIDAALSAVKVGGMLGFTATDLATLCGRYPQAALEKYGSLTFRSEFCHEIAVRVLISYAFRRARVQGLFIDPLLSFYADHYVRVFVRVSMNRTADPSLALGYVGYLFKSKVRKWGNDLMELLGRFKEGNGLPEVAGPLWLGELSSPDFVRRVADALKARERMYQNPQRAIKLIHLLRDELGHAPFYYTLPTLLRGRSPSTESVVGRLTEAGLSASATHFDGQGVRFDAGDEDPVSLLKGLLNPSQSR
ncbi:MAG: hypothetical protein ACP5T5_00410 [Thermoprotei archaeon]|nr:hypothetical protein [TACK group archaeon]